MPHNTTASKRNNSSPITRAKQPEKKSFRKRAETAPIWDNIPAKTVHVLVCACATANSPATLSYTRDGTALVVSVYHDGERYVDYLADEGEVSDYLNWLLDDLLPLSSQDVTDLRAMLL